MSRQTARAPHALGLPGAVLAFHSGMSRVKDFNGAACAGVPIGVVAGELTMGQQFKAIPQYLLARGYVFIDSGAFSEFKTGCAPDFHCVLSIYEFIAEMVDYCPLALGRLYVVAPDKVGDQLATLERLARYRTRICALIAAGVRMIVPIQRGDAMSVAQMLERAAAVLGTREFVAGIPSNKEAMTLAECATLAHHSFHILGRVQKQAERLQALAERNPAAHITADANWLRSRLATVCALTERFHTEQRQATSAERFVLAHPRTAAVHQALRAECTWAAQSATAEPARPCASP